MGRKGAENTGREGVENGARRDFLRQLVSPATAAVSAVREDVTATTAPRGAAARMSRRGFSGILAMGAAALGLSQVNCGPDATVLDPVDFRDAGAVSDGAVDGGVDAAPAMPLPVPTLKNPGPYTVGPDIKEQSLIGEIPDTPDAPRKNVARLVAQEMKMEGDNMVPNGEPIGVPFDPATGKFDFSAPAPSACVFYTQAADLKTSSAPTTPVQIDVYNNLPPAPQLKTPGPINIGPKTKQAGLSIEGTIEDPGNDESLIEKFVVEYGNDKQEVPYTKGSGAFSTLLQNPAAGDIKIYAVNKYGKPGPSTTLTITENLPNAPMLDKNAVQPDIKDVTFDLQVTVGDSASEIEICQDGTLLTTVNVAPHNGPVTVPVTVKPNLDPDKLMTGKFTVTVKDNEGNESGAAGVDVAYAAPTIKNLAIDCSKDQNVCLGGKNQYPLTFDYTGSLRFSIDVTNLTGIGTPATVNPNQGQMDGITQNGIAKTNLITGDSSDTDMRITINLTGPGGVVSQSIDMHQY